MTVPGSIFSKQSEGTNKFIRLGATPVTSSADILETLGIKENQKTNNSLPKTLSENEKNVLKIAETPVTKNELVSLLGISISDANVLITSMELKGLLSEKLGKIYTNSI
jgi:DNA processing protein